jgi:uncharacterized RDD family membrane protein YckC
VIVVADVEVVETTEIIDAEFVEEPEYVGLVTRVIAFAMDAALIDLAAFLVAVAGALVFSILPVSDTVKTAVVAAGGVAFVVWSVAYFATFWTTTGQTPGNRAMRIRVEREDGERLRLRHTVLRLIGIVVSLPLLWGFAPILVSERRRGVPDMLAGTVVVAAPRQPAAPRQ